MAYPYDTLGVLDSGTTFSTIPSHAFSPYSTPVEYKNETARFFCTPTLESGEGWGSPFVDGDGKPLPYGTLGGEWIAKAIFLRDDEWKAHHRGGTHQFGEIDWYTYTEDEQVVRISYHGTSGRHIHDGFEYGSDILHQLIYFKGKVLCVAPAPVMGASLFIDDRGKWWVVAITHTNGVDEVFYRKVHSSLTLLYALDNFGDLSDKFRNGNPHGWKSAGILNIESLGEVLKPTTPFFAAFNGLTFSQCRNTLVALYNDGEATEEVASGIVRVKLSSDYVEEIMVLTIKSTTFEGEQDKFTYTHTANKFHDPTVYTTSPYTVDVLDETVTYPDRAKLSVAQLTELVNNACPPWSVGEYSSLSTYSDYQIGCNEHHWVCSHIVAQTLVTGSVPFGVDYIGNKEIIIKFVAEHARVYISQWSMGVDGVVKYGSYSAQKLIDAPDNQGTYTQGVGLNNSTPTCAMAIGGTSNQAFGSLAPAFSSIPYKIWIGTINGMRSDVGVSLLLGEAHDYMSTELAYNSQRFSVKYHQYMEGVFSVDDGTTGKAMAAEVKHRLEYTANSALQTIPMTIQTPQSTEEYDADEPADGVFDSYMHRLLYLNYLDIRKGSPFYIAEVEEIDVVRMYQTQVQGGQPEGTAIGEKRKRIEVVLPDKEPIKIYTQDAEEFETTKGEIMQGWSFYPRPYHTEPMAATVWAGDPAVGIQPPMTVAESFSTDNQPRTYGTLANPLFGANDTMYHVPAVDFIHHTLAYPIADTNDGYLGWATNESYTPYIPEVLNQPLQNTTFSWSEKYFSYYLKMPEQGTEEPNYPRLDSFITDSVLFDNDELEFTTFVGAYETHEHNRNTSTKVSAATDGAEYIVSIEYSTTEKPTCYYSYFTGSDSELVDLTTVGENFSPVGVR